FTTRKSGHGFGLHSCALAAKQMGGTLSAHSDGPGRGATFTLELPIDTAHIERAVSAKTEGTEISQND
ncbi:MAG TPA: ATP-binding protein, partial [Ramlibacter sp.]|nr:ATP-binding protein [Ramlibacter sp.]